MPPDRFTLLPELLWRECRPTFNVRGKVVWEGELKLELIVLTWR